MSARLKKIIGILSGILFSFLLLLLILPSLLSGNIKSQLIARLNEELNGELRINGASRISLLSHFPEASLSIVDFDLLDAKGEDTIFHSERLALLFNPIDLIRGKYSVRKVNLGKCRLAMRIDSSGQRNFDILKKAPELLADDSLSGSPSDIRIDIREIRYQALEIEYRDEKAGQFFALKLEDGSAGLNFSGSMVEMNIHTRILMENPVIDEKTYDLPEDMMLSGQLTLDTEKGIYRFVNTTLSIGEAPLEVRGLLEEKAYGFWTDFLLRTEGLSLETLTKVAGSFSNEWKEIKGDGICEFFASVKGPLGGGRWPHVEGRGEIQDGRLSTPFLEKEVEDLDLELEFSNGAKNQASETTIRVKNAAWKMGSYPIGMQASFHNLLQPAATFSLNGTLDLRALRPRFFEEKVTELEGLLIFEDVEGTFKSENLTRLEGVINAVDVIGELEGQSFGISHARIKGEKDDLDLKLEHVFVEDSDLDLDGELRNWTAYFDSEGDDRPFFNLKMSSGAQDWDQLESFMTLFSASSEEEASSGTYLDFLRATKGNIEFNCEKLNSGPFSATDIRAEFRMRPYMLLIDTLSMQSSGGRIGLRSVGRYFPQGIMMQGSLFGHEVDVHQLFRSFDNFGQDYLVADNLKGRINGRVEGTLYFDPNLEVIEEKNDLTGDLTVNEGALIHFEPMRQLSAFVKVKELENIQFSTLRNIIYLQGDRVILPVMSIKSTAMNLWLSGDYFYRPDSIDYYFKIDLLDVLARKFSLSHSDLNEVEKKGEGLIYLYVAMRGPSDDPEIEFSKRKVMNRFEEMNLIRENGFIDFEGLKRNRTRPKAAPRIKDDEEIEFIEDW